MKRNHFVRVGDIRAISAWREQFNNTDVYATPCRFSQPNRNACYVCDFFLDIDAEHLALAQTETLKACDLLVDHLEVEPEAMDFFFSGAKGFHVILSRMIFGNPTHPEMIKVWCGWAKKLAREGIRHFDLGIYQPSRVLRLPNSVNSKTGLYKIPLEYKEIRDYGIENILEMARKPRDHESLSVLEESPKAATRFAEGIDWVKKRVNPHPQRRSAGPGAFRRGWRVPPCIRGIEAAALPDGLRHASYLVLARYYVWIGMHPLEAEDRIMEIDGRHPVHDPDSITRAIQFGAKHPGFAGCSDPVLEHYCKADRCFRTFHARKRS